MKTHSLTKPLCAGLMLFAASQANAVIELTVDTALAPLIGGPTSNVAPVLGQTASYRLNIFDTVTTVSATGYLQVELVAFSGVTNHHISTGQGGNTDRVGIAIVGSDISRTATYTFSFFEDDAFTTELFLGDSFIMQVSDIDQAETVAVNDSSFDGVTLSGTTDLVQSNPSDTYLVQNVVGENADKTAAAAAANFNGKAGISTFDVTITGSGPSGREFQFEFTPDIVVPEPSTYAFLAGLVTLGSVMLRRRSRNS